MTEANCSTSGGSDGRTTFCCLVWDGAEPRVQIAALRDCLTDDTVRVLRNLELSETDRIDVEKSIDALEKYANGQVNEVIERKKFNERVQAQGESFDDFLTSLKELVRSCNFCNECRDSLIRDRVIMGLRSAETVKCLCATPDLSLSAAVAVCRAQEATSRDALELYSRAPDGPSAQQVRSSRAGGGPASCAGCGRRRHRSEQHCPARGQRCRACQGLHHFAAVCPSRMDCRWNRESRDRYQSSSPPRDRYPSPRPRGRYPSSPPRDRYPSPPPRGMYRSPSPRGRYRPASQDRLQPRQVRFEQDDYASGRRPTASAIIASASVQGAPRIRVHVKAYEAASVEALPDTGGEFPENLLPPDEHPKAANGEVIKSIGILPVHITLGDTTVEDNVHILPTVTGLLLSWVTTRKLNIIPEDYPRQMKSTRGLSSDAAGDASKRQDVPPTAVLGVEHRAGRRSGSGPPTAPPAPHPTPRDTACAAGTDAVSVIDTARQGWSSDAAVAPSTATIEEDVAPSAAKTSSHEKPATPGGSKSSLTEFPDVVREFPTVFDGNIRCMPGEEYQIYLREDAVPFCVTAPRRVPLSYREPLREELKRLQDQDIIFPVTTPTDWCAPIVVSAKKAGGIRLCVDLSKLNKHVRRERYQSPTPAEEVASIAGQRAQWFTVVDAAKGYHQCVLAEESRLLTTFTTPFGRYAFKRAPYGVASISEHCVLAVAFVRFIKAYVSSRVPRSYILYRPPGGDVTVCASRPAGGEMWWCAPCGAALESPLWRPAGPACRPAAGDSGRGWDEGQCASRRNTRRIRAPAYHSIHTRSPTLRRSPSETVGGGSPASTASVAAGRTQSRTEYRYTPDAGVDSAVSPSRGVTL